MGVRFQRFLHSTFFSLLVLIALVAGIGYIAYNLTQTYKQEPDFGGMVTIRQAKMINTLSDELVLTQDMIRKYITSPEVLAPIAARYEWNAPYEEMCERIEIRERLATHNSFIIVVNAGSPERSLSIARALASSFLQDYRAQWSARSREYLAESDSILASYNRDLEDLFRRRETFQDEDQLRPLNNEVEMRAINDQLVEAQKQFLAAYGAFVAGIEERRASAQMELELAQSTFTENDARVRMMRLRLDQLERRSEAVRSLMASQKPDLYRLTMDPEELVGLPDDIVYFYDNVQVLQRLKLSMMIDTLIEEKKKMISDELTNRDNIRRMLNSNSCDVFIREVR